MGLSAACCTESHRQSYRQLRVYVCFASPWRVPVVFVHLPMAACLVEHLHLELVHLASLSPTDKVLVDCATVDFRRSNTMPSRRQSDTQRSALPFEWRNSMAQRGANVLQYASQSAPVWLPHCCCIEERQHVSLATRLTLFPLSWCCRWYHRPHTRGQRCVKLLASPVFLHTYPGKPSSSSAHHGVPAHRAPVLRRFHFLRLRRALRSHAEHWSCAFIPASSLVVSSLEPSTSGQCTRPRRLTVAAGMIWHRNQLVL